MIIGAGVPVALSALSVIVCLVSKWILLSVLSLAAKSVDRIATVIAALLVLPDYWLSSSCRARGRVPSSWIYVYGDVIGWTASTMNKIVGRVLCHTIKTMRETPALLVAATSGLVLLVWSASPLIH